MAVRLVIGRAGTGKTALCVRELRAEMAQRPLGGPLLWITPEQATFSAERLLLTDGDWPARGSFRAQVLSFRRLALILARQLGLFAEDQVNKPMDEVARVVLLEEIVRRHRGELTVFSAVADRPGFVARLDAILRELRQHGHCAASLRELQATAHLDAVTRRKIGDLAILLEAWSAQMERSECWDFERIMHAAALRAGDAPLIVGAGAIPERARVWVDAFSALSALEIRMLAALGLHGESLTITLLADPDSPALREMRQAGGDALQGAGLFARTQRLHRRLVDAFRAHGVAIEETVALRQQRRFVHASVRCVEADLFAENHSPPPEERDGDGGDCTGGVELWQCAEPETEVRAAARTIRDLVLGQHPALGGEALRYRQIAVIVPDLDAYHDALRRALREHGIPHFIDQRRSVAHHPLVELLRSAAALSSRHWDRQDILLLLKTQLAGVDEADVALLENYLIEHGIDHRPWSEAWTWIAPNQNLEDADDMLPASAQARLIRVNVLRQRVWEGLRGFVEAFSMPPADKAPDAARYPRLLKELLQSLRVESQIGHWSSAAREQGDEELAQTHEQVWRQVDALLNLLETILGGCQRTPAEFDRILATALENLTLGLIPPTVDQVIISSVTRSRVPEIEAVLVLGAVEGQFPKVLPEDPILSDAQREAFNACAADPIEEGADRQLLEMPFFDYVALTRARRLLVVSRPVADRKGKALGPSRHLAPLEDLLGAAIVKRRFGPAEPSPVEQIATYGDMVAAVARWARGASPGVARAGEAVGALYNQILAIGEPRMISAGRQAWRSLAPVREPQLGDEPTAGFFPSNQPLRLSVSQLESYASCRLRHFLHYTLDLRPRAELQLDDLGKGNLLHRILERVYRRVIAGDIQWPQCDPEDLRRMLAREVDGSIEELHAELAQWVPGYDKTRIRIRRVLGKILEADRRRATAGGLRPIAVELGFGPNGVQRGTGGRLVSLPVLAVSAADGRLVHIRGKIDRMDGYAGEQKFVSVVDYKSSAERVLNLHEMLEGLGMQLPTYALVAHAEGSMLPMAALYMRLGIKRRLIAHTAESLDPADDRFYREPKPRGIIVTEEAWRLDRAITPGKVPGTANGNSAWFAARFRNDGNAYANSDALGREDFEAVLAFTRWKIARLAEDLMRGRIAPNPYRRGQDTPCNWCDFKSLCPFDRAGGGYRQIAGKSRQSVLESMRTVMDTPQP